MRFSAVPASCMTHFFRLSFSLCTYTHTPQNTVVNLRCEHANTVRITELAVEYDYEYDGYDGYDGCGLSRIA
jgi:hypothetical protein